MRRGCAILLAALMTGSVLALPSVLADDHKDEKKKEGKGKGGDKGRGGEGNGLTRLVLPGQAPQDGAPPEDAASDDPLAEEEPSAEALLDWEADDQHESALRPGSAFSPSGKADDYLAIFGMGAIALLVLGAALLLARLAAKPRSKGPPRKSFEAGRKAARAKHAGSMDEAWPILTDGKLGKVVHSAAEPARVRISIVRKRGMPCEYVAGFLTGTFESVWASDVVLQHAACAEKEKDVPCTYDLARKAATRARPDDVISYDAPRAGAWTPGSGGEPRRWPRARSGGG